MNDPQDLQLARRLNQIADPPPAPAEFIAAVRARRQSVVRTRVAWSGGLGTLMVLALVFVANLPRSVPIQPPGPPIDSSLVIETRDPIPHQSLAALHRDWLATGRLPELAAAPTTTSESGPTRMRDAEQLHSAGG